MPWGFDEAGSPVKGEMELTFSDIKCRKSLKDGEKREIFVPRNAALLPGAEPQKLLTSREMVQTVRWVVSRNVFQPVTKPPW